MNVRTMLASVAAVAFCGASVAASLSDGLAAYFTFDEATPVNHAPGATVTGMTLSSGGAAGGTCSGDFGHPGFGGYLDIDYGWARLEGSENLEFANGNDFTAVMWMRAEASQTGDTRDPAFFGNGNWYGGAGPKQPGVVLSMYYNTTQTDGVALNYSYLDGSAAARTRLNTYPVPLGAWTFYAVTHTADGKMRFYRSSAAGALTRVAENDVPDLTLAYDAVAERRPFYLGQDGTGAYPVSFKGKIDEFALWTRGLGPDDINAVYQNGRRSRPLESLLMPEIAAGDEAGGRVALAISGEHPGDWDLYVGSGEEDAGADRFAWDHLDRVAAISASDSSYTYTLPAEFASEGRYYRFFLSKASLAPYQEIEYVANAAWNSAEAAYLGTGFTPTRDTTVSTEVEIDDYSTYDNIFGCCDRSTYWFYHLGFFQTQWYTEITKYEHAAHTFTTKFGSAAVGDRCAFVYGIRGVSYWDGKTDGAGTWQALLNNPAGFPDGEVSLDLFRCPKPDEYRYTRPRENDWSRGFLRLCSTWVAHVGRKRDHHRALCLLRREQPD